MTGRGAVDPGAEEEALPDLGTQQRSTSIPLRPDFWKNIRKDLLAKPTDDEVQELLLRLLETAAKADGDQQRSWNWRLLAEQLKDYEFFKDRKAWISSGTQSLSYDRLALHWILSAPVSAPSGSPQPANNSPPPSVRQNDGAYRTELSASDTFADWACRIATKISEERADTLQLMVIAEQPNAFDVKGLFSFLSKTLATMRGNITRLHSEPAAIMRNIVISAWSLPYVISSRKLTAFDAYDFARPVPSSLIFRRYTEKRIGDIDPRCDADAGLWGQWFDGDTPESTQPGDAPGVQKTHVILLSWQLLVSRYTSDMAVYISEPQRLRPEQEYARITYSRPTSACSQHRLLVLFRGCHNVTNFSKIREFYRQRESSQDVARCEIQDWTPEKEIIFSVLCIFSVMIRDVEWFVRNCHSQLKAVHSTTRSNPSRNKMKFLLHLEDSIKANLRGVQHGLEILRSMEPGIQSEGQGDGEQQSRAWADGQLSDVRELTIRDFELQEEQIKGILQHVDADQELLRSRFQLVQDRRVFTLTIFAAIFLPLSFTTSIFGMNIDTETPEGPSGFSEWMNSTLGRLSSENRIATEILSSATATSGSLSFSWKTFGITAGCLLMTLPISLAIGATLRAIVGGVAISAAYWRAVLILVGMFIFYMSISGAMFSIWAQLAVNMVLCLGALFLGYRARKRQRRRRMWFWRAYAVSFGPATAIWYFFPEFGFMLPWMVMIPYIWLRLRIISRTLRRGTESENEEIDAGEGPRG